MGRHRPSAGSPVGPWHGDRPEPCSLSPRLRARQRPGLRHSAAERSEPRQWLAAPSRSAPGGRRHLDCGRKPDRRASRAAGDRPGRPGSHGGDSRQPRGCPGLRPRRMPGHEHDARSPARSTPPEPAAGLRDGVGVGAGPARSSLRPALHVPRYGRHRRRRHPLRVGNLQRGGPVRSGRARRRLSRARPPAVTATERTRHVQLPEASQDRLVEMGIRQVIDLRWASELADRPSVFAGSATVRYLSVPLLDNPPFPVESLPHLYRRMIDERAEQLAIVVRALLAPEGLPAIIGCAGGIDRTAVTVGLLLSMIGVPAEVVAADYALSSACYATDGAGAGLDDWRAGAVEVDCLPEYMVATLEHLEREHGGAAALLGRHGIESSAIDELVDRLTEVSG